MKQHKMYKSPTYSSYRAMISRCTNPNRPNYKYYGGRGIKVCKEWLESFHNFLKDMGVKPEGHQLDRTDVNGNYEPGNCAWVTPKQNVNNRRIPPDHVSGKMYGQWKALSIAKYRGASGEIKYHCQCSCGFKSIVKKKALLDGTSTKCKSCAEKVPVQKIQSIIGNKYNQWTVLSIVEERTSRGKIQFLCECTCGFKSKMIKYQLENDRSKSCRTCAAFGRNKIKCTICFCYSHRSIDFDKADCDLIGFCSRCDKFDINKYLKGREVNDIPSAWPDILHREG